MLLTACVDDSYDLDDIDTTLATDIDLAMPLLNTGEIKLVDFLKSSDFIGTANVKVNGKLEEIIYAHASGDFSATIPAAALQNGVVQYEAQTPPVIIPSLPDFMKADNVHFDLFNPIIILNIASENLPDGCTALVDVKISTEQASCTVQGIEVGQGKKCRYIATQKDDDIPANVLDALYGKPQIIHPSAGSVNALFAKKMPDKLQVEVSRVALTGLSGTPTEDVNIKVAQTLYAPLRVGSTFSLVYEAKESDWEEEFDEDVRKMDVDMVMINADLISNLPVGVSVSVVPIDPSGNRISGLTVLETNAPAANAPDQTTSTKVSFTLKSTKQGTTIRDFLNGINGAQQLDGVRVVTKLDADGNSVGKYITSNAYAKFNNLELRAKGKFIYDAN